VLLEWGSLSWRSVRRPNKKEEGKAPMAMGLSEFFFLRAHVMRLRTFSLLRALLAPWSLVCLFLRDVPRTFLHLCRWHQCARCHVFRRLEQNGYRFTLLYNRIQHGLLLGGLGKCMIVNHEPQASNHEPSILAIHLYSIYLSCSSYHIHAIVRPSRQLVNSGGGWVRAMGCLICVAKQSECDTEVKLQ
jgi:hypothetical protein